MRGRICRSVGRSFGRSVGPSVRRFVPSYFGITKIAVFRLDDAMSDDEEDASKVPPRCLFLLRTKLYLFIHCDFFTGYFPI